MLVVVIITGFRALTHSLPDEGQDPCCSYKLSFSVTPSKNNTYVNFYWEQLESYLFRESSYSTRLLNLI